MNTQTASNVDDMFKESANDDKNHHAFDGVFDVDDLLETRTFNESIDGFGNSNDFSMSASGIGEDEFGVFECEPSNSMIGSTSHHESFACSSPISPRRSQSANFPSALSSFGNENASLTEDDLYNETTAPSDDQYISFSDITSEEGKQQNILGAPIRLVTANYNDTISSMNRSDNISIMQQTGPSCLSPNHSQSNDNLFAPCHGKFDTVIADTHHDDLLQSTGHPQMEQQDNIHCQRNQNQQQQPFQQQSETFQINPQMVHMNSQCQQQHQFHPTQQPIQNMGGHSQSQFTFETNNYQPSQQPQSYAGFQINPQANISNPSQGRAFPITSTQPPLNNSSHGANFQYNSHAIQRDLSQGVFRTRSQGISTNTSQRGSFQASAPPLTSNSYHGIPYRKNENVMMNTSSHFPATSSMHDTMQRRNSSPFSKVPFVNNASFVGMQNNVAIPQERHAPQKYFSGFESQTQSPSSMKNPPANMNEVMEKLTERMRQSAMSRNMVKHISGRSLVSQNSSRGLLASQGSSRAVGQISGMMNHGSTKNLMKQGSERSVGDGTSRATPIRRVSSNAKHQLPGRSLHQPDSYRSLNHSNHGTISLQIDGRNVGNF